jgi:branched-subunit amino acid permease
MTQVSKTRNIIGWVLSALPLLALVAGAAKNKIPNNPELAAKIPYINSLPLLGILCLVLVALYLIPKTSNIGFFLLCSYFGGVIVGELAMGEFPLIGIVLSICLYVGTMLKKPELSGLGL